MAIQISRLAILLGVDQKGLATGLKSAESSVKGFTGRITSVLGGLKGLLAFGPIAGVIGGITKSVFDFAAAGDAMDKMSARTGVLVEELSRLKFAADRSGGSVSDIDAALRGSAKFILRLSEGSTARDGTIAKADQRVVGRCLQRDSARRAS